MVAKDGKLDLTYDLVRERLAQQIDSVKSLDLKASIILAFIGVVFTGYLQLIDTYSDITVIHIITILLIVLAGVYCVLIFVQFKGKDWRNDPEPKTLNSINRDQKFSEYSESELKEHIVNSIVFAYESNREIYKTRYKYLYISLSLVLAAVIMIAIQLVTMETSQWQKTNNLRAVQVNNQRSHLYHR